jgi:hypothetical protein
MAPRRALAITAASAILAAAAPEAEAAIPGRRPAPCRPTLTTTLLVSKEARVYRSLNRRVYGCLFAVGRPFRLDRSDFRQTVLAFDTKRSRLAGPYVAYTLFVRSPGGVDQADVYVRNLRTGVRKRHRRAVELANGIGLDDEPSGVDSIVLRSTGAVAWIASAAAGGEVHRIDSRGHRLLDSWQDHEIALASLKLTRTTIRWSSDGVIRTASLR